MNESIIKVRVIRIVTGAWLFGWFCKIAFYAPYLIYVVFEYPIKHDHFPRLFQSNSLSLLFYFLPILAVSSFFINKKSLFKFNASLILISAVVLNLHINSYNDAMFVTSFWVALWLVWFSFSLVKDESAFKDNSIVLGHCIVGIMFLGGFVGKLTPQYFSGEIINNIFIEQAGGNPFALLLNSLALGQKAFLVSIAAKMIIITEGLLTLNIFVYHRVLRNISLAAIPLLAIFSTWRIFSVTSCLLGILVAIAYWNRSEDKLSTEIS